MLDKLVEEFFISLVKDYMVYNKDKNDKNLFELNRKMEVLYGQKIMGRVSKSKFLRSFFAKCKDKNVVPLFDQVIEHLFTPIAWTTSEVVGYYALRNYVTGKFVVAKMGRDTRINQFIIKLEYSSNPFPLLMSDSVSDMKEILDDMEFASEIGCYLPDFASRIIHKKCIKDLFAIDEIQDWVIDVEFVKLAKDINPSTLDIVSTKTIFSK